MKQKVMVFMTALALCFGLALVSAPSAAAATGTVYVFDNTNYNGVLTRLSVPVDCDSAGYRWGLGTAVWSIGRKTSSVEFFGDSVTTPHCNYMTVYSSNGTGQYSKCIGWSAGIGIPAVPSYMNDNIASVGVRYVAGCRLYSQ